MKKTIPFLLALIVLFSYSGCSSAPKDLNLNDVMAEMEKQVSMNDMMTLQESDLVDLYGMQQEDIDQFCARMMGDGVSPDEIIMIKATDADAAARIQQALETRLQSKRNEAKSYNPDAYSLMQKSNVTIHGTFVSLLVSSQQEELTAIYNRFVQ